MKRLLVAMLFVGTLASAQIVRHDDIVLNRDGRPVNHARIEVCLNSAPGAGCTAAPVYDSTGTLQPTDVVYSDTWGNYFFYVTPGTYKVRVTVGATTREYPDQNFGAGGGGGIGDPGNNGLMYRIGVNVTRVATYLDVANLFNGGGPCYLKKDGTCDVPSAGSGTFTPPGASGNLVINNSGAAGAFNTQISGSDINFPGKVTANEIDLPAGANTWLAFNNATPANGHDWMDLTGLRRFYYNNAYIYAMRLGSWADNDCPKFQLSTGSFISSGGPCGGGGGGSGTINSGVVKQVPVYSSTLAVSGYNEYQYDSSNKRLQVGDGTTRRSTIGIVGAAGAPQKPQQANVCRWYFNTTIDESGWIDSAGNNCAPTPANLPNGATGTGQTVLANTPNLNNPNVLSGNLKGDPRMICFRVGSTDNTANPALLDTDDITDLVRFMYGATVTFDEVWCESDAGTPSINLLKNGATSVLGANLTCTSTGASTTTFNSATFADHDKLSFQMVAAGGTAKRIAVCSKFHL